MRRYALALFLSSCALLVLPFRAAENSIFQLGIDEWADQQTCEPYAWKDYEIAVTAEESQNNLFVQAQDLTDDAWRSSAISLYLFDSPTIPANRESPLLSENGNEQTYTLSLSYREMRSDNSRRLYASVLCGAVSTEFKIKFSLIPSDLREESNITATVCEGGWMFHKALFDQVNLTAYRHASVTVVSDTSCGACTSQGQVGLKFGEDELPNELFPHYSLISSNESSAEDGYSVNLCDISDKVKYYVGIQGTIGCVKYTLALNPFSGSCADSFVDNVYSDKRLMKELVLDAVTYEETAAYTWKDFFLTITEGMEGNLLFEVEDLLTDMNPQALKIHLFPGAITSDRQAPITDEYSSSQRFTVSINSWDLEPQDYFLSVEAGPSAAKFRVIPRLIPAVVNDGGHVAGVVCPNDISYHYFESLPESSSHHIRYTIELHTGDIYYRLKDDTPPLTLTPPYQYANSDEYLAGNKSQAFLCNAKGDTKHYIGLLGVSSCANYDLYVDILDGSDDCEDITHTDYEASLEELNLDHFQSGVSNKDSWTDYKLQISASAAENNLVIEVEDLQDELVTEALSVHLYQGSIPGDRITALYDDWSNTQRYVVSMNLWDLTEGTYFVSVYAKYDDTRYRVLARLVEAAMLSGDSRRSTVCPGDYIYHYIDKPSDSSPNLRYTLELLSGDAFWRLKYGKPPLTLQPPYQKVFYDEDSSNMYTAYTCDAKTGENYIGLRGGTRCAQYSLKVDIDDSEDCIPFEHDPGDEARNFLPLELEKPYTYIASQDNYVDFYLYINGTDSGSAEDALNNLQIEVEDLGTDLNPEALCVYMYVGSIPADRYTPFSDCWSNSKRWVVARNAYELTEGDLYISVKINSAAAVKFRVLARLIAAEIEDGSYIRGTVCPGEFMYHYYDKPDNSSKHIQYTVELLKGDCYYRPKYGKAPLTFQPPYQQAVYATQVAEGTFNVAYVCNAKEGKNYMAMIGGDRCALYRLAVETVDGEQECTDFEHDPGAEEYNLLQLDQFYTAYAEPSTYTDFYLHINEEDSQDNLQIEVEDLGTDLNPEALCVYMYVGSIPGDRHTPFSDCWSNSKRWVVARNAYELTEGDLYISVKINSAAAVKFRVLARLVSAEIEDGSYIRGTVCPGEFMYHYYDKPDNSSKHIQYTVELLKGDCYYRAKYGKAPLTFQPPFQQAVYATQVVTGTFNVAYVCNAKEGKNYMAMIGGDRCALYRLAVETVDGEQECTDFEHDPGEEEYQALRFDEFYTGLGSPSSWTDFYLYVSEEDAESNLVIEVEDLSQHGSEAVSPMALEVCLYEDFVPADRKTPFCDSWSNSRRWVVSRSSYDLVPGAIYVSVRTDSHAVDMKYRILARLVPSEIEDGTYVRSTICPGDTYFHHVNHSRSEEPLDIKYTIELLKGDMYFRINEGTPPLSLSAPYQHAIYEEPILTEDGQGDSNTAEVFQCNAKLGDNFVGLFGGQKCALYRLAVDIVPATDSCKDFEHDAGELEYIPIRMAEYFTSIIEPFEYVDFSLIIPPAQENSNLVVEVEDLSGVLNPTSLSLYLYTEGDIPGDRSTAYSDNWSNSGRFVVVYNMWDLRAGVYFISLSAGHAEIKYRLVARSVPAEFETGDVIRGTVCDRDFIYHYTEISDEEAENYYLQYYVTLHSGEVYYVTREDEPPLTLIPPYVHLNLHNDHNATQAQSTLNVCLLEGGKRQYLALHGGAFCSDYTFTAALIPRNESSCNVHEHTHEEDYQKLELGVAASFDLAANSYMDLELEITEDDLDNNLYVEVEDLGVTFNPSALEVSLFEGSISQDRKTEFIDNWSNSRAYVVAVNSWELSAGHYFISVKVNYERRKFRVIASLAKAHLLEHEHTRGVVCVGDYAYHYYDFPEGGGRLDYHIEIYTGDVYYLYNIDTPPLKLTPPYRLMHSSNFLEANTGESVTLCSQKASRIYLALRGEGACVNYKVTLVSVTPFDEMPCVEAMRISQSSNANEIVRLKPEHLKWYDCNAGETVDFEVSISEEEAESYSTSLMVEDRSKFKSLDSMSIYLYKNEIPEDRKTEIYEHYSANLYQQIWSIFVDQHELEAATYYLSVTCHVDMPLRALLTLIPAQIENMESVQGDICSGYWMHHFVEVPEDFYGHLRFNITLRTGELDYMIRPEHPPIKRVPPYRHAATSEDFTPVVAMECNVLPGKWYLGLRGGGSCASYVVTAVLDSGGKYECTDMVHDETLTKGNPPEELHDGSLTYGSCVAKSYRDYYFDVQDHDNNFNLAFEVEDLNAVYALNPKAIGLYVFEPDEDAPDAEEVPADRLHDYADELASADGQYSVQLDITELLPGRYFASIKCASHDVRFTITVHKVEASLKAHHAYIGSVAPAEWVYYYYEIEEGTEKRNFFTYVEIYNGDIYQVSGRMDYPPGFTSKNTYNLDTADNTTIMIVHCNAEYGKNYIGHHFIYCVFTSVQIGAMHLRCYSRGEVVTNQMPK
ncbi:hypothetical protein CYMTET_28204 [Cymbomonas tetramitiformis]|uniref:Uncharacterized protein n=1 Tax=Cymbomonas tetramitiformis TaxID=36881 RepID=A0AAE0FPT5_9CHLO|nr:hypothetical protein CYMTET_28204 [Cymbomonas tetramitiformis]